MFGTDIVNQEDRLADIGMLNDVLHMEDFSTRDSRHHILFGMGN